MAPWTAKKAIHHGGTFFAAATLLATGLLFGLSLSQSSAQGIPGHCVDPAGCGGGSGSGDREVSPLGIFIHGVLVRLIFGDPEQEAELRQQEEELLRPTVIQALGNALLTTQLGYAVLAAQTGKNNADLLLRGISLARLAPDVLQSPLCGSLMAFCSMSHRSLLNGDDEPKLLP